MGFFESMDIMQKKIFLSVEDRHIFRSNTAAITRVALMLEHSSEGITSEMSSAALFVETVLKIALYTLRPDLI